MHRRWRGRASEDPPLPLPQVTFNTVAFTETNTKTFFSDEQDTLWNRIAVSTWTLFILFLIALKGAGAFAKVNTVIFIGLVVSLGAGIGTFWFSRTHRTLTQNLRDDASDFFGPANVSGTFYPWTVSGECADYARGPARLRGVARAAHTRAAVPTADMDCGSAGLRAGDRLPDRCDR